MSGVFFSSGSVRHDGVVTARRGRSRIVDALLVRDSFEDCSSMNRSEKPVIGLNVEYKPSYGSVPSLAYLFTEYSNSVIEAGAIPVLIPPTDDSEVVSATASMLDGFIMVGGSDLDPRNDGFMLHRFVRPMDPFREQFDRALMDEIARQRKPFLGIGVGMQLLNVSQGGALFLHIPEDIPDAMPHRDNGDPDLRHPLVVEKGSLLERVYGKNNNDIRVNSRHHMAVDDVAPGFMVTARCPGDQVIEAIESVQDDWFALGVQFHPEATFASNLDQRIFSEFVRGVIAYKNARSNV